MDLERAKGDLISALGAEFLDERPNDSVQVEALRAALYDICSFAPFEEVSAALVSSSREVDLSIILDDLVQVGAIMRAADASTSEGTFVGTKWRDLGSGRVMLEGGAAPLSGEVLRVKYRRAYTVAGLDGALGTNLPYVLQRPWVLRACAEVVDLMLRRMMQVRGRVDDDDGRRLQAIGRDYRIRSSKLVNVQVGGQMVTWANLGEE